MTIIVNERVLESGIIAYQSRMESRRQMIARRKNNLHILAARGSKINKLLIAEMVALNARDACKHQKEFVVARINEMTVHGLIEIPDVLLRRDDYATCTAEEANMTAIERIQQWLNNSESAIKYTMYFPFASVHTVEARNAAEKALNAAVQMATPVPVAQAFKA